jgi:hypothetical protein
MAVAVTLSPDGIAERVIKNASATSRRISATALAVSTGIFLESFVLKISPCEIPLNCPEFKIKDVFLILPVIGTSDTPIV